LTCISTRCPTENPCWIVLQETGGWVGGETRHGEHRGTPVPMLHVDVHGKKDRKTNLDLDVGVGPMEVLQRCKSCES
jgi:hypothetical protein